MHIPHGHGQGAAVGVDGGEHGSDRFFEDLLYFRMGERLLYHDHFFPVGLGEGILPPGPVSGKPAAVKPGDSDLCVGATVDEPPDSAGYGDGVSPGDGCIALT